MQNLKRGAARGDAREFDGPGLEKLRRAAEHVRYLINEGYDKKGASAFVGNHFLLSKRQRLALMRSEATDEQTAGRKAKEIAGPGEEAGISSPVLAGRVMKIDGFNTIITLEIALCGSLLLECRDGCIRDLAGLRGTYRMIPETGPAVRWILRRLRGLGAAGAVFYLDEPVSNSGRLKSRIAQAAEEEKMENFPLDIQICRDVDRVLMASENVISSDSVILDACGSWFNLSRIFVEENGVKTVCLGKYERGVSGGRDEQV